MNQSTRTKAALRAWCSVSDTIAADLIGTTAVVTVVLVGTGALQPLALTGSGALASLAGLLYRRRPVARLDTPD
jgi:hypothetical protein